MPTNILTVQFFGISHVSSSEVAPRQRIIAHLTPEWGHQIARWNTFFTEDGNRVDVSLVSTKDLRNIRRP